MIIGTLNNPEYYIGFSERGVKAIQYISEAEDNIVRLIFEKYLSSWRLQ